MPRNTIDSFSGEFRFLSNFFPSPIEWRLKTESLRTVVFTTVEHGFVWHKTENAILRALILQTEKPEQVKRIGRKLTLRPGWDDIKLHVMQGLVLEKFTQHENLRRLLLETEDAPLVEGNHWHDEFWGVCHGTGQNHLGKILMQVRTILSND